MGRGFRNFGGQACYDRIQEAFEQIETLIWAEDVERINREFNLCAPLNPKNQLDVWNLLADLSNTIAYLVQFHSLLGDIQDGCAIITDPQYQDGLAGYAAYVRSLYGEFCLESNYDDFVEFARETSWSSGVQQLNLRQWIYQTCSEIGLFLTTSSNDQPFGSNIPLDLDLAVCGDLFSKTLFTNETIHANIRATNLKYGGLNPRVTNVIFTHGDVDPWAAAGLNEEYDERAPVIIIPGASHCNDFFSISSNDSPALRAAKERISRLVKQWISG